LREATKIGLYGEFWVHKRELGEGLRSSVLSSQFLTKNSRLGELYFEYVNFMMWIMVLCHCLLNWNMIMVNSCMC